MSREFKPGDVAWLPNHGGVLASRAPGDCKVDGHGYAEAHWHYLVAVGEVSWDSGDRPDARPLVVIDPEDREQVERLIRALAKAEWEKRRDFIEPNSGVMQAALREFANPTPPRPEEPQGLGAVVREASGRVLVRTSQDRKRPWCVAGTSNHVGWCEMDDEPLEVLDLGYGEVKP